MRRRARRLIDDGDDGRLRRPGAARIGQRPDTRQAVPDRDLGTHLVNANHVGIAVRDLDRSIAFYHALIGRKPGVQERMVNVEAMYGPKVENQVKGMTGGASLRYATLQLEGLNIDIIEFTQPRMGTAKALPTDQGAMHLCFEVDDLDAVYRRMTAAGMTLDAPAYTFTERNGSPSAKGTRVAYFSDPDGHNLEPTQPAGSFVREGGGE